MFCLFVPLWDTESTFAWIILAVFFAGMVPRSVPSGNYLNKLAPTMLNSFMIYWEKRRYEQPQGRRDGIEGAAVRAVDVVLHKGEWRAGGDTCCSSAPPELYNMSRSVWTTVMFVVDGNRRKSVCFCMFVQQLFVYRCTVHIVIISHRTTVSEPLNSLFKCVIMCNNGVWATSRVVFHPVPDAGVTEATSCSCSSMSLLPS